MHVTVQTGDCSKKININRKYGYTIDLIIGLIIIYYQVYGLYSMILFLV